jgi:two-component system LytT family response regulator
VDDEAHARTALRHRLEAAGVPVVGEAASGRAALEAIGELDPDVVFLDVEMADGGGFDVVDGLGEDAPAVVFVTAYDRYALAAFEARALDYVLKPASKERLEEVLARVRRRLELEREADDHRRLLARIAQMREAWPAGDDAPAGTASRGVADTAPGPGGGTRGGPTSSPGAGAPDDGGEGGGDPSGRLVVKRRGEYVLVPHRDVRWVEAAGNYVRIHTPDGAFLHRASLTAMEERLPADRFARVHRSAIVALERIERVVPTDSGDFDVHLDAGDVVKLSRSYRDRLLT